jgi:hypothetical protein
MRPHPLGRDDKGIVHYDSLAKHLYIWPLCSTPYLNIRRVPPDLVVTCVGCLANYVKYDWGNCDIR